ncbi:unnamed protein product, partial [Ixodes hexagonus]
MAFKIRRAQRTDCDSIMELIRELADYERMLDSVKIGASDLENDLFGDDRTDEHPWAHVNVATMPSPDHLEEQVVGYVLYFFIFNARALERVAYMEDLYVRPQHRRKGIGIALWKSVAEHGLREESDVLNWQVLDWNTPAVDFYVAQGAINISASEGYQYLRLTSDVL